MSNGWSNQIITFCEQKYFFVFEKRFQTKRGGLIKEALKLKSEHRGSM